MKFETEILILNSELVEYNFDSGKQIYNRVTFAFRDENARDSMDGMNVIVSCSLDKSSADITRRIKPNELTQAIVGMKPAKDNSYKYVIREIDGIEV